MTSPEIKFLISSAGVSLVYAFLRDIQLSRKAGKLSDWLKKERPDLWAQLNFIQRNWHGGRTGLRMLKRRNVVGLSRFDAEHEQLDFLERQVVLGIVVGSACIGLALIGLRFFGWHW